MAWLFFLDPYNKNQEIQKTPNAEDNEWRWILFLGKHAFKKPNDQHIWKMPVAFRRQLRGEFYLIQGFDQNLVGLTEPVFQRLFQVISAQNIANPLSRLLLRMILGSAHIVQLGRDGGFEIPDALFNFIAGDDDFFLIGQGEYFEIWAHEAWKKQEQELSDSVQNASRFSSLEISIKRSNRKHTGEK